MEKHLTPAQINLAMTLKERHGLDIPFDLLCQYEFGKKFLDLFAYDPDANEMTGFRRMNTIISYLYYDKDQKHLQFKLDLSADDVSFMIKIISEYKFQGDIPRENTSDLDPEYTAYTRLEEALYD